MLLSVKYTLAELYGRVEGYTIDELPDVMLERKVEMCRLVLKTLDVILSGETRMRGNMSYFIKNFKFYCLWILKSIIT